MYVHPKEAAEHYKVTANTIRVWADSGKIKYIRTDGGHRRYLIEDTISSGKRKRIIYCRVSSKKQQQDLERQVEFLRKKLPDFEVIKDIGSGINFKRPGFLRIMEELFDGNIEQVVVAHKDRWSRIGFELFEQIFSRFDATITATDEESTSGEVELAKDLMEIITVFTARFYGKRTYKDNNNKNSSKSGTAESVDTVDE